MPSTLFIILLHVAAMGHDYYALPDGEKYQRIFVDEAACKKAARPIERSMRSKDFYIVEFKGVVCKPLEVVK